MIEAAVAELFDTAVPEPAEDPDPYRNVVVHLCNTVHMLTRTDVGPIFRAVVSDLPRHPRVAKLVNELGQSRRRRLLPRLTAALDAGALTFPGSADQLADALLGAVYFRYLMTREVSEAYAEEMLHALAIPGRGQ